MGKKHSEYHGSMNYDEKERLMITHYFGLLAENSFTEYDILGFLMVLRQELDSEKYKYIYEFANLIEAGTKVLQWMQSKELSTTAIRL